VSRWPYGLFEAVGIEVEYMIVDRETLDPRPIAEALLRDAAGQVVSELETGELARSNELAAHVIELKTNGPRASLAGLEPVLQDAVARLDAELAAHGAMLMPTGMHPWMDPARETRLFPGEYGAVYRAFDRIFGCSGHGWSNLQSLHVNLPFADAGEFGRLHAAIRLVLPILPALAASTPFAEGRATGLADTRLEHYRSNARRIPSVTACVIPEPVFTPGAYQREILGRIYADLAPHDPEGVLLHEWVNARGAIARFDRGTIEIRVLDTSECPAVDVAIAAGAIALVSALVCDELAPQSAQRALPTASLAAILRDVVRGAERAVIRDVGYLRALGRKNESPCRAGELWVELLAGPLAGLLAPRHAELLGAIAQLGCLASRLRGRLGDTPDRAALRAVYGELCGCLARGVPFDLDA
jgi:gamma-glutamyl:cysteine ligase YbdK (ATP-grasp superfamily)